MRLGEAMEVPLTRSKKKKTSTTAADASDDMMDGTPVAFNIEVDGEAYLVKVAPVGMTIQEAEPKAPVDGVTVPMQGVIIRYLVKEGARVSKGDAVAVLEAMKMENEIYANKSGVVREIYVEVGETISPGDVVMAIV